MQNNRLTLCWNFKTGLKSVTGLLNSYNLVYYIEGVVFKYEVGIK
jgi:hypothetical protein